MKFRLGVQEIAGLTALQENVQTIKSGKRQIDARAHEALNLKRNQGVNSDLRIEGYFYRVMFHQA